MSLIAKWTINFNLGRQALLGQILFLLMPIHMTLYCVRFLLCLKESRKDKNVLHVCFIYDEKQKQKLNDELICNAFCVSMQYS